MPLQPDQIPERLRGFLLPGEEVLWVGKPAVRPMLWSTLMVPIAAGAGAALMNENHHPKVSLFVEPKPSYSAPLVAMAVVAVLMLVKLWFSLFRRRNALQAFTTLRVLLPSGWDHGEVTPVNYEDIREIKEQATGFGRGGQGIGIWTHGYDLRRIFPLIVVPTPEEHETVFRVMRRTWLIATGVLPPSAVDWEPQL
ncbi:MAG: hypothetical protein QM755_15380 [Luteolibacter sp.]